MYFFLTFLKLLYFTATFTDFHNSLLLNMYMMYFLMCF
jgi:hypothetical protein